MVRILPGGIGDTTGDALAINSPLYMSGNVWYCDFVNGVDAVSPRGLTREQPLKTLAQAVSNAAQDDIILLLASETTTAAVSVNKCLTIIGSGSTSGVPSVTLTNGAAGANVLTIATFSVTIRNLRFGAASVPTTGAQVGVSASSTDLRCVGCRFDGGANNTTPLISLNTSTNYIKFEGCSFVSEGTALSARPDSVIDYTATTLTDIQFYGCTFDNGMYGWGQPFGVELGVVQRFVVDECVLQRGFDVKVASTSTGYAQFGTSHGASRLEW